MGPLTKWAALFGINHILSMAEVSLMGKKMLYKRDAEVLFPARVTPLLRDLRGSEWRRLIDEVGSHPNGGLAQLAFGLLMIRLNGCLTCHSDSYRAMQGCTLCSQQAVLRYKGMDEDLVAAFEQAKRDIRHWQVTGETPSRERLPPGVK